MASFPVDVFNVGPQIRARRESFVKIVLAENFQQRVVTRRATVLRREFRTFPAMPGQRAFQSQRDNSVLQDRWRTSRPYRRQITGSSVRHSSTELLLQDKIESLPAVCHQSLPRD